MRLRGVPAKGNQVRFRGVGAGMLGLHVMGFSWGFLVVQLTDS